MESLVEFPMPQPCVLTARCPVHGDFECRWQVMSGTRKSPQWIRCAQPGCKIPALMPGFTYDYSNGVVLTHEPPHPPPSPVPLRIVHVAAQRRSGVDSQRQRGAPTQSHAPVRKAPSRPQHEKPARSSVADQHQAPRPQPTSADARQSSTNGSIVNRVLDCVEKIPPNDVAIGIWGTTGALKLAGRLFRRREPRTVHHTTIHNTTIINVQTGGEAKSEFVREAPKHTTDGSE